MNVRALLSDFTDRMAKPCLSMGEAVFAYGLVAAMIGAFVWLARPDCADMQVRITDMDVTYVKQGADYIAGGTVLHTLDGFYRTTNPMRFEDPGNYIIRVCASTDRQRQALIIRKAD